MKARTIFLLFLLAYVVVLIACAPASLLDKVVRQASEDQLALANPAGTLWQGEAVLALRQRDASLTPLQPLTWNLSAPALLTGKVRAQIQTDPLSPDNGAELVASLGGITLHHAQLKIPAQWLNEVSPVLKPAQFSGELIFRSEQLVFRQGNLEGNAMLEWQRAGSALSRIAPLGDYTLALKGAGPRIDIELGTTQGVLLLEGKGWWQNPRGLHLQLKARAAPGNEDNLRELLYHLGPRTASGDHVFNLVPQ